MEKASKPQSECPEQELENKHKIKIRWIPSMLRLYEKSLLPSKSFSISERNSFNGSPHSIIDLKINDQKIISSNNDCQFKRRNLKMLDSWRLNGLEDLTLACFQLTDRMEVEKMMRYAIEEAKTRDRKLQQLFKNDIFPDKCNIDISYYGIHEKAMKNLMVSFY